MINTISRVEVTANMWLNMDFKHKKLFKTHSSLIMKFVCEKSDTKNGNFIFEKL